MLSLIWVDFGGSSGPYVIVELLIRYHYPVPMLIIECSFIGI